MAEFEKLVVGLGNPGEEYEETAHNLGFLVLDRLAVRSGIKIGRKDSRALVGQGSVAGKKVLLAKPQTFMNVSGESVNRLLVKHEIAPGDLIVIYDELDLPLGTIRIRERGSSAGHNGMNSIIASDPTPNVVEIKISAQYPWVVLLG